MNFIPHGMRCEADDGRGSDFGQCHEMARAVVYVDGRDRYVCDFHQRHLPAAALAPHPEQAE